MYIADDSRGCKCKKMLPVKYRVSAVCIVEGPISVKKMEPQIKYNLRSEQELFQRLSYLPAILNKKVKVRIGMIYEYDMDGA